MFFIIALASGGGDHWSDAGDVVLTRASIGGVPLLFFRVADEARFAVCFTLIMVHSPRWQPASRRHCERSEAIHVATCWAMDCFVADAPRNDDERPWLCIPAVHSCPS